MGLFDVFKRDKGGDADEQESTDKSRKSGGDGRKPKRADTLRSVINMPTIEHAIELMRENPDMDVMRDGIPFHVGWLLDCEDIGGLSKNTVRRSEDKGACVECIANGNIEILSTDMLMDENKLVIIPSVSCLEHAREFSILDEAPYKTIFVADDGTVIDLDGAVDVTLADAEAIHSEGLDMTEFLAERGCPWAMAATGIAPEVETTTVGIRPERIPSAADPLPGAGLVIDDDEADMGMDAPSSVGIGSTVVDMPPMENVAKPNEGTPPAAIGINNDAIAAALGDLDEPDDVLTDTPVAVGTGAAAGAAPAAVGTTASAAGTDDDTVFVGEDEDEVDEEPEGEPIVVEPEVALRRITRTMFPDDLDIEVSTDAFDARFSVDDLVLFDEDRPRDNWINDYLNQASSDANMELRHMRASHIETLRSLYLRSMEASVSRIAQMLDDSDDDNEYGHSANIVRTRRDVAQADAENVARDRVRVLRDNFDREVRAAGEDAARLAEKQYRDRHGRRLENQERRMLSEVRREIDVECESSLAEIRERRRETALKLLEVATTTTLERLSQEYVTLRDIEDERMRELAAGIREYVEENRANDVAWTNSIESELDLSDKLDEVRAEYDDRIRRMDEAAEEERARLKTEMDELRERHSRELDDLREDNRVAMERARGERDALSAKLDATMDDYRELDDKKDMQYKASMDSLRDRLAAADERYDTLVDREKRAQLIWIALAVVAIIAALCVGMVIGLNQRIGLESAVTYTQGV